jgi:threonine dehydrogenase-like Zn-dependent dehydrogenase
MGSKAAITVNRPREAIMACRAGGIVSIIGVYGGLTDKFPTEAPNAFKTFKHEEDDCVKVVLKP